MDNKKRYGCCIALYFCFFFIVFYACTDISPSNDTTTSSLSTPEYNYANFEPLPPYSFDFTFDYTIPTFSESFFEDIDQEIATTPTYNSTTTPTTNAKIEVVSYSNSVQRNATASVKIKGKPNTRYSITVIYSSGPSEAAGLYPKISDSNGYVTWNWRIGGRTSFGTYPIIIEGESDSKTIYFSVVS